MACTGIGLSSGSEQAVPAVKEIGRKIEAFSSASVMLTCTAFICFCYN